MGVHGYVRMLAEKVSLRKNEIGKVYWFRFVVSVPEPFDHT
jgi:hypothetical protein